MGTPIRDYTNKYVEASIIGAGRGALGLPIEHPFDVVKTRMQASQESVSAIETIKKVYNANGWRGFYTGAVPNGIRMMSKQVYRWPLQMELLSQFQDRIPVSTQKRFPTSVEFATGLSIASIETGIICPLEHLKVVLITNEEDKRKKLRKFFAQHHGGTRNELYRAFSAAYFRQITSWVSFLVANKKFKTWEQERTKTKDLSFLSLMRVAFLVGGVNTAANLPFDVIKSKMQQHKHSNMGFVETAQKIYRTRGMIGFYAAWHVRIVHYMVNSAFTVTILDRVEKSWRDK